VNGVREKDTSDKRDFNLAEFSKIAGLKSALPCAIIALLCFANKR
jgi:hypothetical protein